MHRRVLAATLICLLAACAVFALAFTRPAAAQGFFDRIFGPSPGGNLFSNPEPPKAVDASRAPPPRKPDTPPTTTILVMGDSMADWLAYGLEDALTDTPEIGILRRHRTGSGLIRFDLRNEALEWVQGARDILATEKPNYIVMMIGLNDRQPIRVRQASAPARGAAQPAEKPPTPETDQENPDQPNIIAPEAQRARTPSVPGVYEFHSEKWEELYTKRIDEAIAVLKSKGVPVLWVGLPSLRTSKATTEVQYLNELYRARAEKAGIVYVDVWDGFVDELGRFTLQGPDYEGQSRRLRAGDGIHFTKAGARKLAHYVEREINRAAPIAPVALSMPDPKEPTTNARPGGAIARPLNGLAVPLTLNTRANEELAGSPGSRGSEPPSTQIATHVLVKGEPIVPPAGRADDFAWPRRGIAAFGTDSVVTSTTMPVPLAQLPPPVITEPASKQAARQQQLAPGGQAALAPPRPPARPSFNPFSFFGLFR
jgi:uncharacterized protein